MTNLAPRLTLLLGAGLLLGAPCLGGACVPHFGVYSAHAAQETRAEDKGTLYHFGTSPVRTNIQFESETDLETIHGSTQTMSGTARLDFDAGTGKTKLTIPVKALKTGIDSRDEHLRSETWLNAEKHPDIQFLTTNLKVKDAKKGTWTYDGHIVIKGIKKALKGEAVVKRIPAAVGKKLGRGEWVKVKTSFQVNIKEFGIEPPGQAAAKVSETWDIKVAIFGTTAEPKQKR
ncbi:MAG: YceI family protein [Planctomycetota bacterium]